jgi:hypothetical protein
MKKQNQQGRSALNECIPTKDHDKEPCRTANRTGSINSFRKSQFNGTEISEETIFM